MSTFTLEDLFYHADIDDVSDEDDGTTIVFTLRGTQGTESHIVQGSNLEDALDQAERTVNRANVMRDLHREGLTDADIDRLAASKNDQYQEDTEAWYRGFTAGALDAAELIAANALQTAATSAPVMAAAAEPIDTLQTVLSQPGAFEQLASGDGIALTIALIHPAKIVLA